MVTGKVEITQIDGNRIEVGFVATSVMPCLTFNASPCGYYMFRGDDVERVLTFMEAALATGEKAREVIGSHDNSSYPGHVIMQRENGYLSFGIFFEWRFHVMCIARDQLPAVLRMAGRG